MISQTENPTQIPKSCQKVNNKLEIKSIYSGLIKLGYGKILKADLESSEEIESYLQPYFQYTQSRMQLIEWLIACIYPDYRQQDWYIRCQNEGRSSKGDKEKTNEMQMVKCLWKIGVMPLNRHTKSLDYERYLKGVIGIENSINLIRNLIELALEVNLLKKSKQDLIFGQFLHECIKNYNDLVNESFDIYGIRFPCKFVDPSIATNSLSKSSISFNSKDRDEREVMRDEEQQSYNIEFQKKYLVIYEEKVKKLVDREQELINHALEKQIKQKLEECGQSETQLHQVTSDLYTYGNELNKKYAQLVEKIEQTMADSKTKNRIASLLGQKQEYQKVHQKRESSNGSTDVTQFRIQEEVERRSIQMSRQFCWKYANYKKIVRAVKHSKQDGVFMESRKRIEGNILQKLNTRELLKLD